MEMIEYLCRKSSGIDSAYIIGEDTFLGDKCWIILIVRHDDAITIEFRRKSQSLNENSLKVKQIVKHILYFP
jgi:hypothetical protein